MSTTDRGGGIVCDVGTSTVRRTTPELGCCATQRERERGGGGEKEKEFYKRKVVVFCCIITNLRVLC